MSAFPRPRLSVESKREIVRRIVACEDETEAAAIAERLWAMLRGDMQDRITGMLQAVKHALAAPNIESSRGSLERNFKMLDGKEIAATTIKPPPRSKRKKR
jgi:hypothetical protein